MFEMIGLMAKTPSASTTNRMIATGRSGLHKHALKKIEK